MDNYEVQSGRIVQAVRSLCPSCVVTFDSSRAPNWVSFQINERSTTLTKGYPEFPASEVANWSDEKLSQMIEVVTDGLVRKSAWLHAEVYAYGALEGSAFPRRSSFSRKSLVISATSSASFRGLCSTAA